MANGHAATRSINLNDPIIRGLVFQILVIGGVVAFGIWLVNNTMSNLESRSIATGFGFMEREAAFAIGEGMIDYHPSDSYGRALLVGLLNTVQVSFLGIALATVLGTIIGVARLSHNLLVAKLASVYVEVIRNIPPLLQLFFWYALITESMPPVRQALEILPHVFITQRGVWAPVPAPDPAWGAMGVAFAAAAIATWFMKRWATKRRDLTGEQFPVLAVAGCMLIGLPLFVWLAFGAPTTMNVPELSGFNFRGGMTISPEFLAILIGLSVYTAAFIAEIVRGGIKAVNWGQTEAARALGVPNGLTLRLIVLPQALRVIVPPVTSQYLNLAKNTSLALAIGYPDLVSIANTVINQTGQAIEGVLLIMATFLTISLSISLFMNWYNKKIALVER